jgi:hypothetical protein
LASFSHREARRLELRFRTCCGKRLGGELSEGSEVDVRVDAGRVSAVAVGAIRVDADDGSGLFREGGASAVAVAVGSPVDLE